MKTVKQNSLLRNLAIITAIVVLEVFMTTPVFAHHPLGGRLPSNLFEGIMSGVGHPMLGFDHLAFIVAIGLIAVGITGGIIIPIAFVLATGMGAGIHLQAIDLPIPEIVIAASVVLFGVLLILGNKQKNRDRGLIIAGLAAIAGIFHGHAYGEGIFGAEQTPLIAYLIGFTVIQLAISLGVYSVTTKVIKFISVNYLTRFAGSIIVAIGCVFLSSALTG